ncbi:alpha/beta hydrolase (plasmid) [Erwinia pyri]|uniref:Alpha/beta hydrolase n=1 Tax=Erwinia pyri TaxID=3062598 RepID=A0AA50DN88_9GAMM|nr:alpha/beta hydrolase [Erwinia sp. DE2]WLS81074.1 alpha/beta hydrolase [Erwinia sp. DE2]
MSFTFLRNQIFRISFKFLIMACAIPGLLLPVTRAADRSPLSDNRQRDFHEQVKEAGYVLKKEKINRITLSYAEGPDNGPPLILLHAQLLDWFSYYRVLPELAKFFHVYDIDYPGHGKTITPSDYPMTARQIGSDLGDFIRRTIRHPVYLSGNSSGGLLAVWLAANRPELIKGILLEDPPLFSSEYPRIKETIADRAFRTSYTAAAQDHPTDFLLYWIRSNAQFFRKNVGPGTPFLLKQAIRAYRLRNPGKPAELKMVTNDTVRMLIRGLDQYDPRFGAAFYDGTWNNDFSHAQALARIQCPVMLMQANYSMLEDGILDGAMSKEDAMRTMSLLKNGTYFRVNATHVVNLDEPDIFLSAIKTFFLSKNL